MGEQRNVETLLVLRPIAVDTGSPDREGMLVIANGMLIAVLVRLSNDGSNRHRRWFLEAGFGKLRGLRLPTFATLEDATRWLRRCMKPF